MLHLKDIFTIGLPVLALAAAPIRSLSAQQLSDGTVYAGQPGATGYNGDGGKATSAELYSPLGLAVDSKGNLYIADSLNNRIRVVTASTGVISTFAGSGQVNGGIPTNNDGNPATSAVLIQPSSVSVDGADNIYIFDGLSVNSRVERVAASTGVISTVIPSGVLANFSTALLVASISGPVGMAVDRTGSTVWLAASGQVLKIDIASGMVTTFPTGGSQYSALALAPNGDLIFLSVTPPANVFGPSIYRMNTVTGAITTVFETSVSPVTGGIQSISGLCVDPSGNIFFSDEGESAAYALFRVDAGTSAVTQVAATSSQFGSIVGNSLAADPAGNVYFSEIDATVHRLAVGATLPAPTVTPGGIVPAGSSISAIESGEWVSIFGTNLANGTASWTGNFPITLAGTSVTIDGKAAYLSFVSPGQINLQVPNDTANGAVPVTVTTASGSATSTVTLAQFAPSFLLLDAKHVAGIIIRSDGAGAYGGGTYDIIGPTGISLGYSTVAAKAGDTIELFGTGFGPTTPAVQPGQAFSGSAPTNSQVTVTINNTSLTPSFAGLTGAGLYQINLTLPAGLGTGDVRLVSAVGGVQTPAGVVISLQ